MNITPRILSNKYKIRLHDSLNDFICSNIGTINHHDKNSLCWAKTTQKLRGYKIGTVICNENHFSEINPNKNIVYMTCSNPRLLFAKIVNQEFSHLLPDNFTNDINKHRKNSNIIIGENVFIGQNVSIGNGTKIEHNTTIYSNTLIGENCNIGSFVSIGTSGLGLEKDPDTNILISFPQIGGVIIEDFVDIGPHSTVRRSALQNTRISRGTKIGSLCNVGHNSVIGENCILTSNIIIAGSSKIGHDVFFGIGCTVKNAVTIGNNCTLGQSSVIIDKVPNNETWIGNPAKKFK